MQSGTSKCNCKFVSSRIIVRSLRLRVMQKALQLSFFLHLRVTEKTFAIAILFFSFFSSLLALFSNGLEKPFCQCLSFVTQDACDQYRARFLGNTGKFFGPSSVCCFPGENSQFLFNIHVEFFECCQACHTN